MRLKTGIRAHLQGLLQNRFLNKKVSESAAAAADSILVRSGSESTDLSQEVNSKNKLRSYSCSKVAAQQDTTKSGDNGDYFNSTSLGQTNSSGYVEYATTCSSMSNAYTTANVSVCNSDTSMVTYNTKYADSQLSDDDGLMSVDCGESMHRSMSVADDETDSMKQSTPYNENFARIRSLKVENAAKQCVSSFPKSNTASAIGNSDSLLSGRDGQSNHKTRNKCRRSNTTYTLQTNSKVIDYFNKLEMSKPVKKTAAIRKLNKVSKIEKCTDVTSSATVLAQIEAGQLKFKKDDAKMSETIESLSKIVSSSINDNDSSSSSEDSVNEVEKIQDVLFHDKSLDKSSNSSSIVDDDHSHTSSRIDSPPSSISSLSSRKLLPLILNANNQSSPQAHIDDLAETGLKKKFVNEASSVDCSMEKLRRTISMPGIENKLNCNVSKISIISVNSNQDSIQRFSDKSIEIEQKAATTTTTTSQNQCSEFIRGDPKARLSQKNIKQMFKSVVKHQISALDSLEKFYENHVDKLELERDLALSSSSSNAENKAKINEFFDSQLNLLEERVQTNLKFISENKLTSSVGYSGKQKQKSSSELRQKSSNNGNNLLSQRLSQIMLLNNKVQTNEDLARSKNLINLKANLLSQKNILSNQQKLTALLSENGGGFRRNVSTRNTMAALIGTIRQPYPRSTSNHSTSKIAQTNLQQRPQLPPQPQPPPPPPPQPSQKYQKNISLRKNFSSNESISGGKMTRSSSNETFNDSNDIPACDDEKVVYSKIKRQNKSANSLKIEEFNTPETCFGFETLLRQQEESRNRFRLNYSRNTSIYNSSMRNTSAAMNGTIGESNHLVKYLPPRFSDAHIHLKLNQQKLAANRNELKYLNQRYLSQLQSVPKMVTPSVETDKKPLETSV
jgi:hypothetical protein